MSNLLAENIPFSIIRGQQGFNKFEIEARLKEAFYKKRSPASVSLRSGEFGKVITPPSLYQGVFGNLQNRVRVIPRHQQLSLNVEIPPESQDEQIKRLTIFEDNLLTKKLQGSMNKLEEMKLISIQEQIDELLGLQQPRESEQDLLNRFDKLLEQGSKLLMKLDELTEGREIS